MRRTLTDTRATDLSIALTARLNWREQEQGTFVLEVGQHQHRILLVPDGTDRYRVYAAFAPTYQWQQWLGPTTLDWAQQFAERNARMLLADAKNRVLVDRRAGWRTLPVDLQSKQASWLRTFGVPIPATMTRGDASAILEQLFAERAHERARHRAHQHHAGRLQQSVKARHEHKG